MSSVQSQLTMNERIHIMTKTKGISKKGLEIYTKTLMAYKLLNEISTGYEFVHKYAPKDSVITDEAMSGIRITLILLSETIKEFEEDMNVTGESYDRYY
jgi:hypothetical protein